MAQIVIKTGEDRMIAVKLKDANGTQLNVGPEGDANIENAVAVVYVAGVPVQKYSYNPQEGYGELLLDGVQPDLIKLKATAEQTATWPTGQLKVSVRLAWVDEDFEDGRDQEVTFTLGRVEAGLTVGEVGV